jgi:PAS domain S-box-containing protein
MPVQTARVPKAMEPLFEQAEIAVRRCFSELRADPTRGTIEIQGERYVLVRASAISVDFFSLMRALSGDGHEAEADAFARSVLFDLAHAIGKSDARRFHGEMGLADPIERLAAGPIHFAHSGWALVEILDESRPSPDEEYRLVYNHPYSFEADAWLRSGRATDHPVCVMNAGYSSGWCEESFGLPLVACEILCRAKGDPCCRFIMSPPHRIEEHIARYAREQPDLAPRIRADRIPDFLSRRRLEEDLRQREEQYRTVFEVSAEGLMILDGEGVVVDANPAACALHGAAREEMVGHTVEDLVHPDCRHLFEEGARQVAASGAYDAQAIAVRKDGTAFDVEVHASRFRHRDAPHLLVGLRDITASKRAEEAQRLAAKQWRDTFDAIEDLVILCDRQHRVLQANRAARELFAGSNVVGDCCYRLVHGSDAPHPHCLSCAVFERGEAAHLEIQEPHLGDRWFDVYAYPIHDRAGGTVQMVHVLRDITDRKRAERELARTLAELERFNRLAVGRELRMIELKREVNQMAARAGLAPPYALRFAQPGDPPRSDARREDDATAVLQAADRGEPTPCAE